MTSPAPHDTDPVPAATARAGSSHAHRIPVLLAAGVLAVMLVRAFLLQPYAVSSDSMSPTLREGERVLVAKVGEAQRGDLVVADVTAAWPGPDRATHTDDGLIGRALGSAAGAVGIDLGETSVLGRVVAVAGDEVVCCDSGRLQVQGAPVGPALPDAAAPFSLTVGPGKVFLLSDNASSATDSRTHANTSVGGADGTVATQSLVGIVISRIWPLGEVGEVGAVSSLASTSPSTTSTPPSTTWSTARSTTHQS